MRTAVRILVNEESWSVGLLPGPFRSRDFVIPVRTLYCVLAVAISTIATLAAPDSTFVSSLKWVNGPAEVNPDHSSKFQLPAGYLFLDGSATTRLLTEFGNKTSGREIGFIAPQSRKWFVIVEYLNLGYVADAESETLDTDLLLKNLQRTDEDANAERIRNGWETVRLKKWALRPRYHPEGHQVEWAVEAESGGTKVVNHTVGMLGREGVVRFCLVDPDQSDETLEAFARLVRNFSFNPGHRYVDHATSDRIAPGGLASVVASGVTEAVDARNARSGEVEASTAEAGPIANGSSVATPGVRPQIVVAGLLLVVAVGGAGFVLGRVARWTRRRRRPGFSHSNRGGRAAQAVGASTPAISTPTQAALDSPTDQSGDAGSRRKRRFDAYSYHMAISRDLHWTINY